MPGVRIDEYCNQVCLSIKQRIELFLKICGAVQYAHQNLIIHRDLKPANVLVLADGTPKLLDFGIAKLLREEDSVPELTRTAMRIFTPSYASPEQLRGEPAGTASDVYSLGVMLYELLTGQKPHLVETGSDFAILEAVCRETPPLASAAIKRYEAEERETRAGERRATFASWSRTLRNDFDLILSRAISADVSRRYQTVEQLASDLERFIARLPIAARKDTWIYRARKFSSRHTALVSVASFAFLVLLGAGLALWRENRIAIQQRQRAERRFNDLRALARSNITEVQDALQHVPGGTEARALILRRTVQYLDGLAAEKDNDIDLQRDLASAYLLVAQRLGNPASSNLEDFASAVADYDRSIRIRESILTMPKANEKDRFQLIYARYHKALMQDSAGQFGAAKQNLLQASRTADAILANGPQDVTEALNFVFLTHRTLANVLLENGGGPDLGDPVQALVHSEIALRAMEEAYRSKPASPRIGQIPIFENDCGTRYQLLLFANYEYGLELAAKDPVKGLPWVAESLAIVDKARKSDPADMKLARWYAIGTTTVGNVRRRTGDRRKGLEMMKEGMTQLTALLAKNSLPSGELRYPLAAGFRGLGEDALRREDPLQALLEYKNAERVYAEDAAAVPDDLGVFINRAENMLEMAGVQGKLGLVKDAGDSRRLALNYADRVLRIHSDNPIARKAWLAATAAK